MSVCDVGGVLNERLGQILCIKCPNISPWVGIFWCEQEASQQRHRSCDSKLRVAQQLLKDANQWKYEDRTLIKSQRPWQPLFLEKPWADPVIRALTWTWEDIFPISASFPWLKFRITFKILLTVKVLSNKAWSFFEDLIVPYHHNSSSDTAGLPVAPGVFKNSMGGRAFSF